MNSGLIGNLDIHTINPFSMLKVSSLGGYEMIDKKGITIIVLLTDYCNLSCNYCYASKILNKDLQKKIISKEIICNTFQKCFDLPIEDIFFNWHGGEPLSVNLKYFQEIIAFQKEILKDYPGKKVVNSIQSNITLLDEDWTRFLCESDIFVGVSLDGPARIHDKQRPDREGNSTFGRVQNGIQLLNEKKINSGLLSVITNQSFQYTREIAELSLHFNNCIDLLPCFCLDDQNHVDLEISLTPKNYGDMLIDTFAWWINQNNPNIRIRFFEEVIRTMKGGQPTLCNLRRACNDFITITYDGDIYPCDFFSGMPDKRLGNILNDSMVSILESKRYEEIVAEITKKPEECFNCKWFYVCGGGCGYQTIFTENAHNYFCSSKKRFFSFAAQWLGID